MMEEGTAESVTNTGQWKALNQRMLAMEERQSASDQLLKDKLDEFSRQQAADSRALADISARIGEPPDDSTGREGSGMRKQIAMLIVASRRPTIAAYFAAVFTAIPMVYQLAKAVGWIK